MSEENGAISFLSWALVVATAIIAYLLYLFGESKNEYSELDKKFGKLDFDRNAFKIKVEDLENKLKEANKELNTLNQEIVDLRLQNDFLKKKFTDFTDDISKMLEKHT